MIRQFPHPVPEAPILQATPINAAQCFQEARDGRHSDRHCLSRMLTAHDRVALVPVLDSLCLFYEAALCLISMMPVLTIDQAQAPTLQ